MNEPNPPVPLTWALADLYALASWAATGASAAKDLLRRDNDGRRVFRPLLPHPLTRREALVDLHTACAPLAQVGDGYAFIDGVGAALPGLSENTSGYGARVLASHLACRGIDLHQARAATWLLDPASRPGGDHAWMRERRPCAVLDLKIAVFRLRAGLRGQELDALLDGRPTVSRALRRPPEPDLRTLSTMAALRCGDGYLPEPFPLHP